MKGSNETFGGSAEPARFVSTWTARAAIRVPEQSGMRGAKQGVDAARGVRFNRERQR